MKKTQAERQNEGRNLKSEKSQDNSQPQRNCPFMNSISVLVQIYEPQVASKANIYSPHKVKV